MVLESSSMILLAKVSLLKGLLLEFDEVVISQEVYRESVSRSKELGYDDALITENLVKGEIIKIKGVKDEQMVKNLMEDFNINKGEAESLVLAQEENSDLIAVDDHQAIKICGILELPFTQAIHIVISMVELEKITKDNAIEAIRKLEEYGWYADWIIEDAKREIENIKDAD